MSKAKHLVSVLVVSAVSMLVQVAQAQQANTNITLETVSIQASVAGFVRDCVMLTCSRDGIPNDTFNNVIEVLSTANNPATGLGGGEDQGIIEVQLSSLSIPVSSATLALNVFGANLFPFDIDVYTYSGDGLLTLGDWNQGLLATTFTYAGEASVTIDLTPSVNQAILAGTTVLGVNLRFVGVSPIFLNGPFVAFDTENTPQNPIPPMLLVNIEPEPSMSVRLDIKPGNDRNVVNPGAKGGIWVAVLSDIDSDSPFDPSSQVDIPTVEFGPDGAKAIRHKVKDINKDGLGDLLLRLKIPEAGIACGDTEATLTGETFSGEAITGSDAIITVHCH